MFESADEYERACSSLDWADDKCQQNKIARPCNGWLSVFIINRILISVANQDDLSSFARFWTSRGR